MSIENLINNTELVLYNELIGDNTECSICRLPFIENEIVRKLKRCRHYFHHTCVDNWLKNNTTCPICRQNVNENIPSGTSDTTAATNTTNTTNTRNENNL